MDQAPTKKLVPSNENSAHLILEECHIEFEESQKSSEEFEKKIKISFIWNCTNHSCYIVHPFIFDSYC